MGQTDREIRYNIVYSLLNLMISSTNSYYGGAVFESQSEGKEIRNIIETIRI
jgi:hypothetical protein